MRSFESRFCLMFIAFMCLFTKLWAQDAGPAIIVGQILFDQTTTSLTARLYSPKASERASQQNSKQNDDLVHRVRVASVGQDGRFEFSGLQPESYLLEIYSGERLVYQKVVSAQNPQPVEISLIPVVFKRRGWRPTDMTSAPGSGIFVLDKDGGVSKLSEEQQNTHIDTLFRLKGAYQGLSLAADQQAVYVTAESRIGCMVVRYSLSSKAISERLLATGERCAGIASDGTTIYVVFPARNEIRYFRSWDASSYSEWSLTGVESLGVITFDRVANRLIVADVSGKAYAISISDGAKQLLASNLGWVNSMAASREHILVASGTKILSHARSDNSGENPPLSLQTLTGGHIVGVAVDASDRAWFADFDKEVVQGQLPLN